MSRVTQLFWAALFAAVLGIAGLAPVRAASIPAGAVLTLDAASKPQTDTVQYRRRGGYGRRYYRPVRVYRRGYYRPRPIYRPYPVYYHRRCVTRPRVVWTPYGYVRRWVRICR
jgi:hypothetical protein